jgi:hypothetical protein
MVKRVDGGANPAGVRRVAVVPMTAVMGLGVHMLRKVSNSRLIWYTICTPFFYPGANA